MNELKVGERITLEVVINKISPCLGCYFRHRTRCLDDCLSSRREDGKEVIYKQVQVHTFTDEELKKHDRAISDASYANAIANAKVWMTNLIVSAGMSINKDKILKDFTRWMGETK